MRKPKFGTEAFEAEKEVSLHYHNLFSSDNFKEQETKKPLYTGRYLITLAGDQTPLQAQKFFESKLGYKVACSNEFNNEAITESKLSDADALIYGELGIALVCNENEQLHVLEASPNDFIIEPEKIVYVPDDLQSEISTTAVSPSTWGLKATQVMNTPYTGKNVKIAVLDTGFDFDHPDFTGREIHSVSFVPDEEVQDGHGHGTHCIGTACGNQDHFEIRYGIAKEAIIHVGKVLSNQGSGAQSWILNAISWAVKSGCKVISMSLGSTVFPGQGYDLAYERIAQYAVSKGCIIVAAAGNESRRSQNRFNPIGSPANCPSVLAVAALDSRLSVADFSNRSINPGGQIDIAAPGVMVYSSWPMPKRYNTISGTSMATPHVAGILALLWENYPDATPQQIISELHKIAKKLPLSLVDVGHGLSIAPQNT